MNFFFNHNNNMRAHQFICVKIAVTNVQVLKFDNIKAKIPYLYKSEKIIYEQFSGFSEDAQTLQSDPSTMFLQYSIC